MTPKSKTRLFAVLVVLVVIPIGLFARGYRTGADPATVVGFLATYTGDTLWPIMFYFAARFCFPRSNAISILVFALSLTLALEFSQLWKPPALEYLRQQPIIGFILGNFFIWSDVICCTVGAAIALVVDLSQRAWFVGTE